MGKQVQMRNICTFSGLKMGKHMRIKEDYFLKSRYLALFILLITVVFACKERTPKTQNPLFLSLDSGQTGIGFENRLLETETWNIITYLYFYNGGGTAIGDINGDSLPDIYFTANQGPNKLYLNKGNFQFEDITDRAGVADAEGWKTGVTMADVNADGALDIYVSHVSSYGGFSAKNRLFINDGKGHFSDRAEYHGLDISGLCTQAAFFDYDNDGDLDCYQLRHSVHSPRSYLPVSTRQVFDTLASDLLLKNFGGRFKDVSAEMGISGGTLGYGLGLAISDFNNDGAPDIYVGNDFHDNDYLYYFDKKTQRYTEAMAQSMGHNANFSMGNDAADFNNDALPDFIGLDMKPEDETTLKASAGVESYNIFDFKNKEFGFLPQYPRNVLQLNRGNLGEETAKFSDIAPLAAIEATDWSWAALFADFDLDGWKDLFITNGIARRPNDLDYLKFISNQTVQQSASNLALAQKMPEGKTANYAFRNQGDLSFENCSEKWGLNAVGLSQGTAYGDLDGDGDLDLVVNNLNQKAFIYKNTSLEKTKNKFLTVQLRGRGGNTQGIGAQVFAHANGGLQMLEQQLSRGFQSSVEPILHFGFPEKTGQIDSVTVVWRTGMVQTLRQVQPNQKLVFEQKITDPLAQNALHKAENLAPIAFSEITKKLALRWQHRSVSPSDFESQKLLPHSFFTESPQILTTDDNSDGKTDFKIQDGTGQITAIFLQNANGFALKPTPKATKPLSDSFTNLPVRSLCERAADFDGDGDADVFVAARADFKTYGVSPKSYFFRQTGKGIFEDATAQIFHENNGAIGMVTDAQWVDLNADARPDLVVVGEWMPITIFYNEGERFRKVEIENTSGWWKCLEIADLDGNGMPDLVLGNMGLNAVWRASTAQPMQLFVQDFDQNGSFESVVTYFRQNTSRIFASKDELSSQLPVLKKRFPDYAPFAKAAFETVFPQNLLKNAVVKQIQTFASISLLNRGGGEFERVELPKEVQFSTCESILAHDFDGDGVTDLLLGGNYYEMSPAIGRFDASVGTVLRGKGNGVFETLDPNKTGFVLKNAVRDIKKIDNFIVVASHSAPLQVFKVQSK
jgi:enediyne biosynthesis protein E4